MIARILPAIGKAFSKISWVKEAWDWLTFANEAATTLGLLKRGVAVAAAGAVVAAPVVYSSNTLQQVVKVEDERTKVYSASYLVQAENRQLLEQITNECKTLPDVPVARCEQAGMAWDHINTQEFIRKHTGKHKINF